MDNLSMNFLSWLTFEINNMCPLTKEHPKCPRNHDRFRDRDIKNLEPITIPEIINFVNVCISNYGFKGLVTLHYYNEPLTTKDKVLQLTEAFPNKVYVWTSGVLFRSPFSEEDLKIRETSYAIRMTVYPGREDIQKRLSQFPKVSYQSGYELDNRTLENVNFTWLLKNPSCFRTDWELITDYFGFGHCCCGDWKGEINIGNLKTDGPDAYLSKWMKQRSFLKDSQPWDTKEKFEALPAICQICKMRTPFI